MVRLDLYTNDSWAGGSYNRTSIAVFFRIFIP